MFRCGNILLLTTRLFDVAKFIILTPLSLLTWCRLSFPCRGDRDPHSWFEVLTGVLIKFKFFWDMEPCQFVNSHWCTWGECVSGLPTSWRKFLRSIIYYFEHGVISQMTLIFKSICCLYRGFYLLIITVLPCSEHLEINQFPLCTPSLKNYHRPS
jgi:hypothetical protein